MNLTPSQKTKLRHDVGLLTCEEVGEILNCPPVDVYRQVCLGSLSLNKDAQGKILVSQSEVNRCASGRAGDSLRDTPRICADGWFEIPGPRNRESYLRSLAANRSAAMSGDGRVTFREYLIAEVRMFALRATQKLPIDLKTRSRNHADKFYKAGPQFFKQTCQQAKQAILNRKLQINGREGTLSALLPSLSSEIDQAIKEAF